MDIGIEHSMLITKRGPKAEIMYLPMKNWIPTLVLPNGSNLISIKPLHSAGDYQEMQGTQPPVEAHHTHAVAKAQTVGDTAIQASQVLPHINYSGKKGWNKQDEDRETHKPNKN